jgi:hypothetical protein
MAAVGYKTGDGRGERHRFCNTMVCHKIY